MSGNKTLIMKINILPFLSSLVVLTSTVSAAANQPETKTFVLPTYVVTAPRYEPIELQINARLQEFRRQSLTPIAIVPELSLPKANNVEPSRLAHDARSQLAASAVKS